MKAEIEQKLNELESLVENMDVPAYKVRKPKWLIKNLGERNLSHPDYKRAIELANELMKCGIA